MPVLKILVLGDSGVGKTSLINQYVNGTFNPKYKATIGPDFLTILTDDYVIQLWDTAGQERFPSSDALYNGTDACLLVYDLTNPISSNNIGKWKELVESRLQCPFLIVGNKADLTEHGGTGAGASAKTGSNVESSFKRLVKLAVADADPSDVLHD